MDKPHFVYVTYIASTPEKVWEALTSEQFTLQYWGGRRIRSAWKPGSAVEMLQEDGSIDWTGEVLQAEPPRLLAYTFDPLSDEEMPGFEGDRMDPNQPEKPSRVTFEIAPYLGQVRLTLTHDQFEPGSRVLAGISHGWPAILSSLKSLLELEKPLFPNWR